MPQKLSEPPPTPRWVKITGVAAVAAVVVIAALHLTGHGLGGHMMH
jgi:hypothetical protein